MRADEELGAVAQHATVPMSGGFAGDECASTETVGFGLCVRDWGLRLAEHALAASRRCELTKSWVRLLSMRLYP